MWDPNNWVTTHEYRIYGDDMAQTWAVVDEEDYQWFVQWRWSIKWSRGRRKAYLFRPAWNGGYNLRKSLYLHVEIHRRTGIEPPSPLHLVVDHRNGNSFDCRRVNLRWATRSMNRLNINGAFAHDLVEG